MIFFLKCNYLLYFAFLPRWPEMASAKQDASTSGAQYSGPRRLCCLDRCGPWQHLGQTGEEGPSPTSHWARVQSNWNGRGCIHARRHPLAPVHLTYAPCPPCAGRRHTAAYRKDEPGLRGKRTFVAATKSLEGPVTTEVPQGVRRLSASPAATANPSAAQGKPPVRAQSAGLVRKDPLPVDRAARVRSAGLSRRSQNGSEFVWGGLRIARDSSGRSIRAAESPMPWPAARDYPPSRDASGVPIDYALARYGGPLRSKPPEHPDVVKSRRNRAIASDPSYPNQAMRARNAGEIYY